MSFAAMRMSAFGTKRTCRHVRYLSAFRGKADIGDDTRNLVAPQCALIRIEAGWPNENCDRAMKLAHKLSMQLRAAEERINQLEAEVESSETERPAPKVGFKQSRKRSRRSSSLRDQRPAPEQTSLP